MMVLIHHIFSDWWVCTYPDESEKTKSETRATAWRYAEATAQTRRLKNMMKYVILFSVEGRKRPLINTKTFKFKNIEVFRGPPFSAGNIDHAFELATGEFGSRVVAVERYGGDLQ